MSEKDNIQTLLNEKADIQSRIKVSNFDGSIEVKTLNNEKYIYFSFVSFFSSGYGDIYPISSITRNWAVQEMIISHMIMVVLIPILLTSVQEFIQKQEPEVK